MTADLMTFLNSLKGLGQTQLQATMINIKCCSKRNHVIGFHCADGYSRKQNMTLYFKERHITAKSVKTKYCVLSWSGKYHDSRCRVSGETGTYCEQPRHPEYGLDRFVVVQASSSTGLKAFLRPVVGKTIVLRPAAGKQSFYEY